MPRKFHHSPNSVDRSVAKPKGRGASGAERQGLFRAHPRGFGFVSDPNHPTDWYIPHRHCAGALDGDEVSIVPLPPKRGRDGAASVVAILKRRPTFLLGQVVDGSWITPLQQRIPDCHIEQDGKTSGLRDGDWVKAHIVDFPTNPQEAPTAVVDQVLTAQQQLSELVHGIAELAGVPLTFDAAVDAEVAALPARLPKKSASAQREDLRAEHFVTIDGDDARDFDDAICLQDGGNGLRRLWVAIADVSHYVTAGSAIDEEAQRRGVSVYFPEWALPMLPPRLSENLCSLRPGEDRLVLLARMDFDAKGKRVKSEFMPGIICSRARLTYDQVQELLDGHSAPEVPAAVTEMLAAMHKLAKQLQARLHTRGASAFVFAEQRFRFAKPGKVADVYKHWAHPATRLIESFMVEANEAAATFAIKHHLPVLYRVHDPPPADDLQQLASTLARFGISLRLDAVEISNPGWVNTILAQIKQHPAEEQIKLVLLKCMSQACYTAEQRGHFGLAASAYAHFTSPIRRYPDLLLHRALKDHWAQQSKASPATEAALPAPIKRQLVTLGHTLSRMERRASEVETQVRRLYAVVAVEPYLGQLFTATISALGESHLSVTLDAPYVEGAISAELLAQHGWHWQRRRETFLYGGSGRARAPQNGPRRSQALAFGQRVRVKLVHATRVSQRIELDWVALA